MKEKKQQLIIVVFMLYKYIWHTNEVSFILFIWTCSYLKSSQKVKFKSTFIEEIASIAKKIK